LCTTPDNVEYNCTIAAYPVTVSLDMTDFSIEVVDDTSHVSGGCRATTPDGLSWTCYLGQVAVDKGFVHPSYLGDWAPREYAAG
jgi:hypothetical protein